MYQYSVIQQQPSLFPFTIYAFLYTYYIYSKNIKLCYKNIFTFNEAQPALLNSDDILSENKFVADPKNFCIHTDRSVVHKAPNKID